MFYADQVGLKNVYDKICEFRDRYGEQYWRPAPLLEQLAKEGKTFAEWDEERSGRNAFVPNWSTGSRYLSLNQKPRCLGDRGAGKDCCLRSLPL